MMKSVMAMLASKYLAIKVRMRAIETQLMIQSLLLRDKKMVRYLFQRRKCFNNTVEDEAAFISNSDIAATAPVRLVQVAREDDVHPTTSVVEMAKEEEEEEEFTVEDDIDKVADLFIQRFHHQIWLQKQQSEEGIAPEASLSCD